jgi:uncharacterized protein
VFAILTRQGVSVSRPVQSWDNAIALLFSAVTGEPRVAVIDEFPFLVKASPSLPSIIQYEVVMRPERYRLESRQSEAA